MSRAFTKVSLQQPEVNGIDNKMNDLKHDLLNVANELP